ncbi:hypothetical protein FHX40_4320 [Thermopolyspora flexuosa]|jgi:hypothetical protein|uniref:Uncharacterized protein n=1 Tax=Thermopolyspora flexuosa TaxID=103836 RepID=A0A543J403_9ACTN|nr:hypothetical protein FHX40_4320 [Thermopolyspora flexuosa]
MESSLQHIVMTHREYSLDICPVTGGACPPPGPNMTASS